jgi:hypothetical protein
MRAIVAVLVSLTAIGSPSTQVVEQTNSSLAFSYNDDHTRVIATVPSNPPVAMSMDATVVDQALQNLATMRADMLPPRPMVDHPQSNVQYAKVGRWQLLTAEGGVIVLMILHPGYGYVGVQLDSDAIAALKQNLQKLSPAPSQ